MFTKAFCTHHADDGQKSYRSAYVWVANMKRLWMKSFVHSAVLPTFCGFVWMRALRYSQCDCTTSSGPPKKSWTIAITINHSYQSVVLWSSGNQAKYPNPRVFAVNRPCFRRVKPQSRSLSIYRFAYLSSYLSVCLCICLCIYLWIYLCIVFICLYLSISVYILSIYIHLFPSLSI